MSKIFDALRRSEFPGVEGFAPAGSEALQMSEPAIPPPLMEPEPEPDPLPGSAMRSPGARSATLRISALAPIFPFDQQHSAASEQYRIIRTKILHHPNKPRVLVVSSPRSGDGKTITSINLAASLALKPDLSVLLVDADLRRSSVGDLLGIPPGPGLTDLLAGHIAFDEALVRVEQFPNLWVLTGGTRVNNPAELLDSPNWRAVLDHIKSSFDYTILDATPVAAVADYELVQHACDGVLLVARPDHTDRQACAKALATVPKQKLIGAVLNCVEDWFLFNTHGYGYYRNEK
ncbi:MAG TPA: CpsD/CapB family tyrosine-protein kinase [Bryobacteraceae bacterium]|nr:CpsD/CapB family tyrosine-protein kinase [Bryobacteraceae bacterium]